jgi:cysteinyl-tRNA synthetase
MSKSVGNIVTMREFLEQYNAEIYKWMILSVHYRTVSDFSDAAIDRAVAGLARVYSSMAAAQTYLSAEVTTGDAGFDKITADAWKKIENAMNDDFGTPEVFATMFEVIRQFNNQVRRGLKVNPALQAKSYSFMQFMKKLSEQLALFQEPSQEFLVKLDDMLLKGLNIKRADVDALVAERTKARDAKDFAKSDEYRDKLVNMGISVSDSATGTHWEVTK